MKTYQSLSNLTTGATIDQIIHSDPKAGVLLASIGLAPEPHINETLRSVCRQLKWSEVEIMGWVKRQCLANYGAIPQNGHLPMSSGRWNLTHLTKYMDEEFIIPNLTLLKDIKNDWPRVHQVHGNQYPWLKDMNWYFKVFSQALEMYSAFEKKKFYPLARKLDNQKEEILDGIRQDLKRSLHIIDEDQHKMVKLMAAIRQKGNNFENPDGACTTLRILNQNFKMLFEHLEKQFNLEQKKVLPALSQKQEAVMRSEK